MIVLLAKSTVKEECWDAFMQMARIMVEETRKEPGCLLYDLTVDQETPFSVCFVEKYVDQEAVDAHRAQAHFVKYVPLMQPFKVSTSLHSYEVVEI